MSFVGRNLSSGEHLKMLLSAAITPALLTLVMSAADGIDLGSAD